MKFYTLVHLIVLSLYKKFCGHVTQNGRLKWQNTKCAVPTLFPYPCSGDVLIVESNYDIANIHRGDF